MPSKLPQVSPIVVDAITDMLISDQGMLRPPEKAAALLGLICELHRDKQPFPPRDEVAAHINASIATVDAALSTRLDEGYITMVVETVRGNVQRRHSAKRQRFYVPSPELQKVVASAKQRDARARRRA